MKPERLVWTSELVTRFWDGFAQTRLVDFSFARQGGQSLAIAIDHLLPREGSILDFGAGDGDLIGLLCDRGFQVAGYERSEERQKRLTGSLAGRKGFLGVVGPDSDRQFDLVIMAEVIEHVIDQEMDEVLSRLAAVTRPGGLLVVTTPNNEDLDLSMAYCPVSNLLFHRWQHVRSFTEAALVALLSRAGFEPVVVHKLGFDNSVFLAFDPQGLRRRDVPIPDYIQRLWNNEPAEIGSQTNLLYVGIRRPPALNGGTAPAP